MATEYKCQCGCVLKKVDKHCIEKHEKTYRHIILLHGGTLEESHLYKHYLQHKHADRAKKLEDKYPLLKTASEAAAVKAAKPKTPKPPPMTEEERHFHKIEYGKKYNETHKDEIKAKRSVKVACECGMQVCKWNIAQHRANGLHTKLMQKKATTAETEPTTNTTAIDI